jgi:hypothetical protein
VNIFTKTSSNSGCVVGMSLRAVWEETAVK